MAKSQRSNMQYSPLPVLPNYKPAPVDGVRVGDSPVPGLTLKRILRGHSGWIGHISWSPDGRLLASPSAENTIRIWDVESSECITILKGHQSRVYSVAWSADGERLFSSSQDETIGIWDISTGKLLHQVKGFNSEVRTIAISPNGNLLASGSRSGQICLWKLRNDYVYKVITEMNASVRSIAWSPNGKLLVTGSGDGSLLFINPITGEINQVIHGHNAYIFGVAWLPDGKSIISVSGDQTIRVWDIVTSANTHTLEGHADRINHVSISFDGKIMASKSGGKDNTVRLWSCSDWQEITSFKELGVNQVFPGISFHPYLHRLATLGENDRVIRIWDIDMNILLGQKSESTVRYTTAKLVLVGDSGVGKTGLGWRLAHGEFKEHSSTHGQQFWVIDELGMKREDGTECEAVLWDLAGQHVYRHIHAIFLDNVDAALVLFDPSNRQDPLKGVKFWLEQLRGKNRMPPSLLVGARVDRGSSTLTLEYLAQFCQHYGISGGYISTSAKSGEGLTELTKRLQEQIPWNTMTTTVTTLTFKRIRDYVLALKENPNRKRVLVRPKELRRQLQTINPDQQFTNAEMMTAVGHLQTHGYVTILKSSSGDEYILLAPDLLVDLASSIVLVADKHPRELGAVSETKLLNGHFPFDELARLVEIEKHILIDAAIVLFLEHNVCFRETFADDTLLIFPGLIKQKRPLEDDFPASDDISYVARGRVENLYASLVVLLGYSPLFTRINQWQNQAQYEMGKGEICGFRLVEDREGEIELVLYYSVQMPQRGRTAFQELFERFLYQREIEVTRFPPVVCSNGHRLERTTIVRLIRDGKTYAFCAECGGKIDLPKLDKLSIGTSASVWLQREEATARLRSTYEVYLSNIKSYRRGWSTPRCYLSSVPGLENFIDNLVHDLKDAGVYIIERAAQVQRDDYVIVLDTPAYQRLWRAPTQEFMAEVSLVRDRIADNKRRLISIMLGGKSNLATPHDMSGCNPGDFQDATHYPVSLFNLAMNLYSIPFTHAGFAPLRESLHQQWEKMPKEASPEEDYDKSEEKQEKNVKEEEGGSIPMSEQYVDFDLYIAPDGHAVASSSEGQAIANISIDIPPTVESALGLINTRKTDSKQLKKVGSSLYEWLFPGPIHTHLQQTEAVARQKNNKIRLRLRVEAEAISNLPLEFLYRELGGYFFAVNPGTVLSRYLNVPLPQKQIRQSGEPLHMLAIIADPTDQIRILPDEWESIIKSTLQGYLANGQMTLQTVKQATRKEIRNALLRQKPDIIQFVGHGAYQGGKGFLALVNDQTHKTWLVDDEIFSGLFWGYDDHLSLISLTSCESAKSDNPQGFMGIAPKLVQSGVSAVLAMQYEVYIKTAKIFMEDFYTSIAARKPIDWATQSARNAIAQELGYDNREFATPVLYMRAKDGNVF